MISTDTSKDEIEKFRKLLDYIKRLSEDGVTPLIEKQLLLMLNNSIQFFSHLILTDVFPEIHRLTINKRVIGSNNRIREINHLRYPPACKVSKYGRCNFPKQSVLYASFLHMTAMNETQPHIGDLITESVWRVKGREHVVSLSNCLRNCAAEMYRIKNYKITSSRSEEEFALI